MQVNVKLERNLWYQVFLRAVEEASGESCWDTGDRGKEEIQWEAQRWLRTPNRGLSEVWEMAGMQEKTMLKLVEWAKTANEPQFRSLLNILRQAEGEKNCKPEESA